MSDTILGKWSLKLIIGFLILLGLFIASAASGQKGGEAFIDNLWLSIPMSLATICAIAASITGCVGIVKDKERSVFVYFSTAIGFLVLLFLLGEFLFPH